MMSHSCCKHAQEDPCDDLGKLYIKIVTFVCSHHHRHDDDDDEEEEEEEIKRGIHYVVTPTW